MAKISASTYNGKLVDPKWQRKRLEICERDNWKCQHCGDSTTQLEIHHVEYFQGKEPWEYPNDMLITVCHKCHKEEMVRFKHEQYLLKALTSSGFLANDLLALSTMVRTHPKFRQELLQAIRKYAQS